MIIQISDGVYTTFEKPIASFWAKIQMGQILLGEQNELLLCTVFHDLFIYFEGGGDGERRR